MIKTKILMVGAFLLLTPILSFAQFCSSPQPSLFTSIDYRSAPAKSWQFSLSYDYKNLSKLVSNSTEMDEDDTRTRSTRSMAVGISYSVNDKLAVRTIMNYVQKSIEIRLPAVGREYLRTRGPGDTYLLAEYNLKQWNLDEGDRLSVGGGLKIPTGKSDYTSDEIPVRDDMQPGTGTWDFLVWADFLNHLTDKSPAYLYLDAGYKLTGEHDNIKYGDELYGSIGLMMLPEYVGRFSCYFRYYNTGEYKDNSNNVIPDTGGNWMSVVADIKADIKSRLFGRLTAEVPVKHEINGTQLVSDYNITLSFQYTLLK